MVTRGHRRAAFVLIDSLAAVALLVTAVLTTMVFYRSQVRTARGRQERLAASMLAESEMERLRATPYADIALGDAQPLALALPSAAQFRQVTGTLSVRQLAPGLKEATVRIEWERAQGEPLAAEMAGVFAREEGAP